jgi:hypothetical protein
MSCRPTKQREKSDSRILTLQEQREKSDSDILTLQGQINEILFRMQAERDEGNAFAHFGRPVADSIIHCKESLHAQATKVGPEINGFVTAVQNEMVMDE